MCFSPVTLDKGEQTVEPKRLKRGGKTEEQKDPRDTPRLPQ